MKNTETKLRKGSVKQLILATELGKSILFPLNRYSTVRSTISAARIEYPNIAIAYEVVEDGVKVSVNSK